MEQNLNAKEKALEIAKEIIIASLQHNDKAYMIYTDHAIELAKSLEIIYKKALELIKD